MSVGNNPPEVFQTKVFIKAFNKLNESDKDCVDDEIAKIIDNPEIGIQKKGDLSHLWVHKFIMNNQQVLLGYNWNSGHLTITLMNIGPHENFYREARNRRKADLKNLRS